MEQSPLWEVDFSFEGFEWLVSDDNSNNVAVFLRRDKAGRILICAVNFSPNAYEGYRFGCPPCKELREVFNSDEERFGGSGVTNDLPAKVEWIDAHGKESSVAIRIPPMGAAFFVCEGKLRAKPKPRTVKKAESAPAEKGKKAAVKKAAPAKAAEKKAPAKKAAPKAAEKPGLEKRAPAKASARKPKADQTSAKAPAKTTKKRGTEV